MVQTAEIQIAPNTLQGLTIDNLDKAGTPFENTYPVTYSQADLELRISGDVIDGVLIKGSSTDERITFTSTGFNTVQKTISELQDLEGNNTPLILTPSDEVSVLSDGTNSYAIKDATARADLSSKVPNTRTVNGKALSSDITLTASDVGAPNDADVVKTSGNETIAGTKTFSSAAKFAAYNGIIILGTDHYYQMRSSGGTPEGCGLFLDNDTSKAAFSAGTSKITIGSSAITPESITQAAGDKSTKIATTAFVNQAADGQWVYSSSTIASSVNVSSSAATYSLSSYLPNDSYKYEVLFNAGVTTPASNGKYSVVVLSSSEVTGVNVARTQTTANTAIASIGSCIIPIGTNRNVIVDGQSGANAGGIYSLTAIAYRRIGTNS